MLPSRVRKRFPMRGSHRVSGRDRARVVPIGAEVRMSAVDIGEAVARHALLSAALGVSLVLAGCGGSNVAGGRRTGRRPPAAGLRGLHPVRRPVRQAVTLYTSIVAPEDQPHIDSYKKFEECTGAQVVYEGSKEFEAQLPVRVQSGNPPDLAYVPQPGLLSTLVKQTRRGQARPAGVVANVDQYFSGDLQVRRQRRRHALRRPARRQRQVLRLVLAAGLRGEGLRRARRPGTRWSRCRTGSSPRAASPGAPASAPARPPAGRSPTGSRT